MIYSFAMDLGQVGPELIHKIAEDLRSDTQQRHTSVAIHNYDNPDVATARKLANEIINVSGAEVRVFIRTDNADYDSVWDEDPDPTYWSSEHMKAFYKPSEIELELKRWGADSANKTKIVFSYSQLYEKFGNRMLRSGDVIQVQYNHNTPNLNPMNYRVINGTPAGNFRYIWLYFSCDVETLTADITVQPEKDVMFDEVQDNGQYRETI